MRSSNQIAAAIWSRRMSNGRINVENAGGQGRARVIDRSFRKSIHDPKEEAKDSSQYSAQRAFQRQRRGHSVTPHHVNKQREFYQSEEKIIAMSSIKLSAKGWRISAARLAGVIVIVVQSVGLGAGWAQEPVQPRIDDQFAKQEKIYRRRG